MLLQYRCYIFRLLSLIIAGVFIGQAQTFAYEKRGSSYDLGALFFSRQERYAMEHRQVPNTIAAPAPLSTPVKVVVPQKKKRLRKKARVRAQPLRFDGKVLRSGGKNTIWISGKARYGGRTLPLTRTLRVGQTYDPNQYSIDNALRGGKISIRSNLNP